MQMETVTQTLIQAGQLSTERTRVLLFQGPLLKIGTDVLTPIQTDIPTRIQAGLHLTEQTPFQVIAHNGQTQMVTDTVTTPHRPQTATDVQV
jgi:hypothetical protein